MQGKIQRAQLKTIDDPRKNLVTGIDNDGKNDLDVTDDSLELLRRGYFKYANINCIDKKNGKSCCKKDNHKKVIAIRQYQSFLPFHF